MRRGAPRPPAFPAPRRGPRGEPAPRQPGMRATAGRPANAPAPPAAPACQPPRVSRRACHAPPACIPRIRAGRRALCASCAMPWRAPACGGTRCHARHRLACMRARPAARAALADLPPIFPTPTLLRADPARSGPRPRRLAPPSCYHTLPRPRAARPVGLHALARADSSAPREGRAPCSGQGGDRLAGRVGQRGLAEPAAHAPPCRAPWRGAIGRRRQSQCLYSQQIPPPP